MVVQVENLRNVASPSSVSVSKFYKIKMSDTRLKIPFNYYYCGFPSMLARKIIRISPANSNSAHVGILLEK